MATPYKEQSKVVKSYSAKTKDSWFSKHKALVVFFIVVAAFIAWFHSDYWPWSSKGRINDRLDKVIEICTDNENSTDCKNIQKKYGMTFRYCRSIADMGKTQTAYLNGQSFQMPVFSWYAVAWEGNSSEPPKNETKLPDGTTLPSINSYYGCKEHKE